MLVPNLQKIDLVALAPVPLVLLIVPLVLEAHSNPVAPVAPQGLLQLVTILLLPLLTQELHYLLPTLQYTQEV